MIISKKLTNNGKFAFITDYYDYFINSEKLISQDNRFDFILEDDFKKFDLTNSFFGKKWKKQNREIYSFYFKKR